MQKSCHTRTARSPAEAEPLALNPGQLERIHYLQMVVGGYITLREAAVKICVSYRQAKRLKKAFLCNGPRGVLHGNIGRPSRRALSDQIRTRILHLARTRYATLNDTQLTARLLSEHGIGLSRETVRRILRACGVKRVQAGKKAAGGPLLSCYAREGLMVLWGGITKNWFGDGATCFMAAVDTATLRCLAARFFPEETTQGYFWLLREVVRTCGVPRAFCQHSRSAVRRSGNSWTLEEQLRGERDPSQVERALRALGAAHYLESKRRIVSITALFESFLAGQFEGRDIMNPGTANALLDRGLITVFNRNHACEPEQSEPAWRKLPEGFDLERACSFYYPATVQHDNTVALGDIRIDIPPGRKRISYAKAQVEVRQLLDGSWRVYYAGDLIATYGPTPVREQVIGRSSKQCGDFLKTAWAAELLAHGSDCD
ncbi:MAG: helix-turn-helix domain-containing protein [Deltaproteobacteria bacterium]|nr:helix-turn-helix domain-containing protein [Deltaproteobacteria bacterium]